jgi:tetratricopeptide (TPR) repeat protein
MISEADIFQLFWSSNSMRSKYVRQEWEYAMSLKRPNFIRPTFWEDPLPEDETLKLPPQDLRALHWERLPTITRQSAPVQVQTKAPPSVKAAVPPPPMSYAVPRAGGKVFKLTGAAMLLAIIGIGTWTMTTKTRQDSVVSTAASNASEKSRVRNGLGPEHQMPASYTLSRAQIEAIFRKQIENNERELGPENPKTIESRNELARILYNEGRYEEAEKEYRQVVTRRTATLSAGHDDTITALNDLALALSGQGKYAEAETILRDAIRSKAKVGTTSDNLFSQNNLADVLNREGRYAETVQTLQAALRLEEKKGNPNDRLTLASRDTLAVALAGQRKYAEAEAEFRAVLKLEEQILGADDPQTVISCYNLALCLRDEGKSEEAKQFVKRAADGAFKTLGPEHPDTKKYEQLLRLLERPDQKKAAP